MMVSLFVLLLTVSSTTPSAPINEAKGLEPLHLYVSVTGKDSWQGRLPEPNEARSDGPFRTLNRARDEIRNLRRAGTLSGAVTVLLREGTYALDAPFDLAEPDSGTAENPVTFMAFPGDQVCVSGGRTISSFTPVTDPAMLQRLDEAARPHVVQADLKAQGISDYGEPNEGGAELFFDAMPMTLSRWPNEGFIRIADIVEQDGHAIHGIKGSKTGKFKYEGDRPSRWTKEQDPWVHGYWFWDWSDQRQRIESVDTANNVIAVKPPYHGYGYRKGQWYYAFNMLSELDAPGEWYIDREHGVLYFWPPQPVDSAKTVLSVLPTLVTGKDVSYVTFRGITFEACRKVAITIDGGRGCRIETCVIRNTGAAGASLNGREHCVADSEIYRTGAGGISLSGGNRDTLEPGGLQAVNNDIHDYGRVNRMYTPGIGINGVGNRAANNLLHDAPHMAIMFGGNDHVIEYNEIHHVCMESNDAGAIYAGRNWTMRGHEIRYNYMHDVTGFENKGCVGVYLDDMFASASIHGNVFRKVTRAAFIGGGRDCSVENNIFIDCEPALHVDARALNWAAYHADEWIKEAKEKGTLQGIAYNKPPYSERYPKLVTILDDNPKAPVGNVIARNICVGGKWDEVEEVARPLLTFTDNLVNVDPPFADATKEDFRLRPDSPAIKLGFKPIPMELIGRRTPSKKEVKAGDARTAALLAAPEVPATVRAQAWMNLAGQQRANKHFDEARQLGKRAVGVNDTTSDKGVSMLEAQAVMDLATTHIAAGDRADARKLYARVARMKSVPAYYRSLAQLHVGQLLAKMGDTDKARKAYAKVATIADAPPHHAWEAQQSIAALERIQAGLPPRDSAATRTVVPQPPAPALTFYVAKDGNDGNAGTLEQPFATVGRVLNQVASVAAKGLPVGGLAIRIRQGLYRLDKGLSLSGVQGRPDAPIVVEAYNGETVVLSGGVPIGSFHAVSDPAVLARIPEEARGKVLVADLKAQGLTQFPPLVFRGFGSKTTTSVELYFDGRPMCPARWPNEGFVQTGKVLDAGGGAENKGGTFEYENDRPARWTQAKDPWLYGYWYYDWADNAIGVAGIDPATKQIRTIQTGHYGVREKQAYYAFNLLEEIDLPGEWYLDRQAALLYFYPPSDPAKAKIELSVLADSLLNVENSRNILVRGVAFEMGAGNGLVFRDCDHCLVAGCSVRRFAATGVSMLGGTGNGVLSCDIHTLGRGGTTIIGGDRKTLTPGGHFVENCSIHDFSRIDRTYTPAVQIEGVGNRIAHNEFYDTPCHAIRLEGNDHIVEFNNVHDVVRESDDQGGIDLFLNPSYRGNVLRYNFWHNIHSGRACGQAGIRLDDAISGTLIYGNVFHRCSEQLFGGVQIHGGKDNWVDNNIFAECRYGISFSPWGKERWDQFLASESMAKLLTQEVDIARPPYSTRYPALARLHEGNDINMVWRNLVYRCGEFLTRDRGQQILIDNAVTHDDPGFGSPANGDFSLKPDTAVCEVTGFSPIPFSEIGLYVDDYRAALKRVEP